MPEKAFLNIMPYEIDDARSDAAEARWKKREKEMKDAIKAKVNALRVKAAAKAKAKVKASGAIKAPKVKKAKAKKGALARKGSTGSLGRKGSTGSLSRKPSGGDLKKTFSSGALKRSGSSVRLLEVGVDHGRRGTGQKWQFVENDKTWRDYSTDASAVVEQHFEEWEAGTGEALTRKVKSGDWHYTVDFSKMEQQNADHHAHTKRRIRRVPDSTPAGGKATGAR